MEAWEWEEGKWVIRELVKRLPGGRKIYHFVSNPGTPDERRVNTPDEATLFGTEKDAQDFLDRWTRID